MRPSGARHRVVLLGVALAIITYVDRACLGQAAPFVRQDLHLSKADWSWVTFSFTLAYALFEIPGGWMGDRYGPRKVLLRVVTWWSACTAALGGVWNMTSLVTVNFLFGGGEAGAFPNIARAFKNWLPQQERVRAQGIIWMAARWGGAVTPMLVMWVLQFVGWREAFPIFGAVGVVWAVIFYRWFRDHPHNHPSVNEAELALMESAEKTAAVHGPVPWGRFVRSLTVWLLWLQYFCVSFVFWFYMQWLPTYLIEYWHVDVHTASRYAVFPLLFGGFGCIGAGLISPLLNRWTGSVKNGRRLLGALGMGTAAVMVLIHTQIESALPAMIVLGLAGFGNDLSLPGAWAACMDAGGRYAGTLSGSMNMMGNFGGALASVVVGHVGWQPALYSMVAVYAVGAVCWAILDPVTPIAEPQG